MEKIMWPFDKLKQLEIYRKELEITQNRIHDLERTVEIITGQNQILTQQLEHFQASEASLLDKIFTYTGIIKENRTQSMNEIRTPININRKVEWPKVKQDLELKARQAYWE